MTGVHHDPSVLIVIAAPRPATASDAVRRTRTVVEGVEGCCAEMGGLLLGRDRGIGDRP
jgi:hypothetical protein